MPVVPQVMSCKAPDFIWAAEQLQNMGYGEVNLNLGCPSGTVTAKGKGSGFLAKPEELDRFFDEVFSNVQIPVSVKTRMGIQSAEEFPRLLEIYNKYPITCLTIHARVQKEKYRGAVHLDEFGEALANSKNPVCYNGDLRTVSEVRTLEERFPQETSVMIGRGAVADPALLRKLRGGSGATKEELQAFLQDLYQSYQEFYGQVGTAAQRMREVWFYLIHLFEDAEKAIYRATITILDTIPFTGLLFLHKDSERHPFIISQHGGDGTPELVAGFFNDKTYNYNNMTERIFRLGANVFAPQLLMWSNEYETDGFRRNDRDLIDAQMKQLGGSITALEVFCIIKSLDTFCEDGTASENHLGMIGLSYGGLYTLFTAATDPRIKAALSCAYYNKRDVHRLIDWTWRDSAAKFFDAEIAMLVYPRCLCIAVADQDNILPVKSAEAELQRLQQLSQSIYGNANWFHGCVFSGTHEFVKSDDLIKTVIAEALK